MSSSEIAALLAAAFGETNPALAGWYTDLLVATPPLRAFTAKYATKIRKKARLATSADSQRDLRCELAVAARAADRRSPVIYEPPAAKGQRGPDFLLRYKGHTVVYVEVSRLRQAHTAAPDPNGRLASLICGKLSQLAAGAANLLVLVSDDGPFTAEDIGATIERLRRRADAKDDAYFAIRGLEGARALHQTLPRLSGVLAVAPAARSEILFLHAQARHPLPADLARAVRIWNLAAIVGPAADALPAQEA